MNSRMEKYYKDDTLPKRSTKNQKLYESIYDEAEYDEINIAPKARTINLEELRQILNSTPKRVERRQIQPKIEEEKVYDLNEAIEQARKGKVIDDKKRSISNTSYDVLKGIKLKKNSDNLDDLLDTISTKNLVGEDLDIFENLKSLDDTTVGIPVEDNKTTQMDDSFFTKSMNLGPSDFETLNDGLEKNSKMMKIIFILILVLIFIVLGIIIILIV